MRNVLCWAAVAVVLALPGLLLSAQRPAGVAATSQAASQAASRPALRTYPGRYYTIHTDLDDDTAREAVVRMAVTAQQYAARTRSFAGAVRTKMPFILFKNPADYYAAGGIAQTCGMYNGTELMATAGAGNLWHTVQHEAFHQFAGKVITPHLPIWVNEGMAEFFGEGIWTGDDLVTGIVSPSRLRAVQEMIRKDQLLPMDQMIAMSHKDWNATLTAGHYIQAWSMVHFLAHGDDDHYQGLLGAYINDIARGVEAKAAFTGRFGRDMAGFKQRYSAWWLAAQPSSQRYHQATVAILTSFLARATIMGKPFQTADAFFQAGQNGELAIPKELGDLYLPPALLAVALKQVPRLTAWTLTNDGPSPTLRATLSDGTQLAGTFILKGRQIQCVQVTATKAASKPAGSGPAASKP